MEESKPAFGEVRSWLTCVLGSLSYWVHFRLRGLDLAWREAHVCDGLSRAGPARASMSHALCRKAVAFSMVSYETSRTSVADDFGHFKARPSTWEEWRSVDTIDERFVHFFHPALAVGRALTQVP